MKKMTFVIAMGIVMAMAAGAVAQDINWVESAGGDWHTPAHWSPETVPGAQHTAIFNLSSNYTVTFTNDVTVNQIRAPGGTMNVTFDLMGYQLQATNQANDVEGLRYAVASPADVNLTFQSSTPGAVLDIGKIRGANSAGRTGNVTFTGSNLTVNLVASAGDHVFSTSGDATAIMSGGVAVNAIRPITLGAGSQSVNPYGLLLITDPGTRVTNTSSASSPFIIGKTGTNMPTLVVSNSAYVYAPGSSMQIGQGGDSPTSLSFDANGRLVVTGAGTKIDGNNLIASIVAGNGVLTKNGYAGTAGGFVVVEQGGELNINELRLAEGFRTISSHTIQVTNVLSYGELIIRDSGSVVRATAAQEIGRASQGAVYVLNGARYEVADNRNIEMARSDSRIFNNLHSNVNANAYGLMVISNAGSYVEARALFVGGPNAPAEHPYGYGDVIVADNAHLKTLNATDGITLRPRSSLTVSDALVESATLIMETNTTLRLELGLRQHLTANAYTNAYINLTGALTRGADVNLEIAFLDDFDFAGLGVGDEVFLISFSSITGSFTGWTPGGTTIHSGDYSFLYDEYSTEAYLTVTAIPEPGTLGLIGAGVGLAAMLRRRRAKA
ncbi:MAG: PEP-CTERM sorting domain-containing protein [Kiritimatiellia bacterium]|nr:PEP-CTERM sorting domain-containing protein [Kiritimatiellia bacterium]